MAETGSGESLGIGSPSVPYDKQDGTGKGLDSKLWQAPGRDKALDGGPRGFGVFSLFSLGHR
jgi:hypothetical protein